MIWNSLHLVHSEFTFCSNLETAGYHYSKISSEMVGKKICWKIKRRQDSAFGMGEAGGTQEEERKGGADQKGVWEEDESQNQGGLWFAVSCTGKYVYWKYKQFIFSIWINENSIQECMKLSSTVYIHSGEKTQLLCSCYLIENLSFRMETGGVGEDQWNVGRSRA